MSFIAGYLLGLGEGEAVTEEITIEENGEYLIENHREDPAAVGWHKVVVDNLYEKLWRAEHDPDYYEETDTGIDDGDGNPIIFDGHDVTEDFDNNDPFFGELINTLGGFTLAFVDNGNVFTVRFYEISKTPPTWNGAIDAKNLVTGQSHSTYMAYAIDHFYKQGYAYIERSCGISGGNVIYHHITVKQYGSEYAAADQASFYSNEISIPYVSSNARKYLLKE